MEALETCYVDGKMFREGQTMYPKEEPCSYCICQKGFDNSTAYTSNKMCKKVDCNIELRSIERFHEGCVPVYLGANYCCPIDWRCRELTRHYIDKYLVCIIFLFTIQPKKTKRSSLHWLSPSKTPQTKN